MMRVLGLGMCGEGPRFRHEGWGSGLGLGLVDKVRK